MKSSEPEPPRPTPAGGHTSDHLANERTFLAWVRTSISLLGLGFVLARMGLFIRQLAAIGATHIKVRARAGNEFLWTGVLFLLVGTALAASSGWHFGRVTAAIEAGRFGPSRRMVLALTLAVVGGGLFVVALLLWQTILGVD